MSVGLGLKVMTTMIIMNFMFFIIGGVGGEFAGFGIENDMLTGLTGSEININGTEMEVDANDTWGLGDESTQSTTSLFVVVDYLSKVMAPLRVFISFLYAPILVLNATGLPSVITYLLGMLWTLFYLVAIMQFIRGGIL